MENNTKNLVFTHDTIHLVSISSCLKSWWKWNWFWVECYILLFPQIFTRSWNTTVDFFQRISKFGRFKLGPTWPILPIGQVFKPWKLNRGLAFKQDSRRFEHPSCHVSFMKDWGLLWTGDGEYLFRLILQTLLLWSLVLPKRLLRRRTGVSPR